MNSIRRLALSLFVCAILARSPFGAETPEPKKDADKPEKLTAKGVDFFESKIRPVLTQRCYSCHASSSKEVKGGLLLDTRDATRKGGESGAAVVPGDIAESLLIQAIKHENYEMPPGDKLADSVIADFEEWVRMGAPDPRTGKATGSKKVSLADARSFWSFKRPTMPKPPEVADPTWSKSEIDRFVLARLTEKKLHPVSEAEPAVLARRVYFDLIGLPPTPEQLAEFERDSSPEGLAKLIDRLLASPQFGERWGRHWLDVARFGESTGKERNVPFPYAWRYRDYVFDAFHQDKPYDRFIREQVAGDLLKATSMAERNENLIATGFLAIGTKGLNERNREQYLMDVADEQIDVTTRAVLGMTIACARCHDHKFDPISQNDYYAVAGVFRSTEVLAGLKPGNNKTGYEGPYGSLASGEPKPKLSAEQQAELQKAIDELKAANDRKQSLSKIDPAKFKGKGKIAKKAEDVAEKLEKRIERLEAQVKDLREGKEQAGEPVMAVRDANNPANCKINIRGEVKDLGPEVSRGVPVVLSFDRNAKFATQESGRAQLASWLVSRENPLTARVAVNRVWAHLFGRGLVETVDNFGTLGEEPTHPELLDYLAVRFMDLGWSHKKLIQEIMLSKTYRLSSGHQDANYAVDPDNRLLWRMNRRRLEAEVIRDSILAISGKLDLKRPAGSIVKDNGATEYNRKRGAAEVNLDTFAHRSVYLPSVRGRMPEILAIFDAADPSLIVSQREMTTVAPQALFMMNSPFVMEQSTHAAKRVLYEATASDDRRLELAYRIILGRTPTAEQRKRSLEYVRQVEQLAADSSASSQEKKLGAWASLCQTLISSGEFRYVY